MLPGTLPTRGTIVPRGTMLDEIVQLEFGLLIALGLPVFNLWETLCEFEHF